MTNMGDVAAGAEASRRAAWAKYFDARDALAEVAAWELKVAVFGDSARFVWHADHMLHSIDKLVNLESLAPQIAQRMHVESSEGLKVPGVVDQSESSARALITAWRREHNVHGRGYSLSSYGGWPATEPTWEAWVDSVDRINP